MISCREPGTQSVNREAFVHEVLVIGRAGQEPLCVPVLEPVGGCIDNDRIILLNFRQKRVRLIEEVLRITIKSGNDLMLLNIRICQRVLHGLSVGHSVRQ